MKLLMNAFNEVCLDISILNYLFEGFYLAGKFTFEHIYDRSGRTFVPNVPVHVKTIVAERTYAAFTEFLNPYL